MKGAKKFAANLKRDKLVKQTLKKQGWNVIVIWECKLKPGKAKRTLEKLSRDIPNL